MSWHYLLEWTAVAGVLGIDAGLAWRLLLSPAARREHEDPGG
jgi:hypothetical protein